uniref:Calpain n=1 Tax=Rhizophora mucronata TaxID=61149 RepID=A0A2P2KJ02_RHIMU
MALYFSRTSVGYTMPFSLFICMGGCHISSSGAYNVGMLASCDIGPRHNWSGGNIGWHCSSLGILFNHALVENTMAKFKGSCHSSSSCRCLTLCI